MVPEEGRLEPIVFVEKATEQVICDLSRLAG